MALPEDWPHQCKRDLPTPDGWQINAYPIVRNWWGTHVCEPAETWHMFAQASLLAQV
tara:strand:- start:462 stop:632 length:171 start_codon:yes stop_codon:yes gene_type:complete